MKKRIFRLCIHSVLFAALCVVLCFSASAKGAPISVVGNFYEFPEKSNYEYSSAESSVETNSGNTFGTFRILSDAKDAGIKNGFAAYSIDSQDIQFFTRMIGQN